MTEEKYLKLEMLKREVDLLRNELDCLMQLKKMNFDDFVYLRIGFNNGREFYFRQINLYELFKNLIANIPLLEKQYEKLYDKFITFQ